MSSKAFLALSMDDSGEVTEKNLLPEPEPDEYCFTRMSISLIAAISPSFEITLKKASGQLCIYCFNRIFHPELFKNILSVAADGIDADGKGCCYFFAGMPFSDVS